MSPVCTLCLNKLNQCQECCLCLLLQWIKLCSLIGLELWFSDRTYTIQIPTKNPLFKKYKLGLGI